MKPWCLVKVNKLCMKFKIGQLIEKCFLEFNKNSPVYGDYHVTTLFQLRVSAHFIPKIVLIYIALVSRISHCPQ